MATITYKVCDRCGAQHKRDNTSKHPVQEVKWFVPATESMHQTTEAKTELCTPCRKTLSDLIWSFVRGET